MSNCRDIGGYPTKYGVQTNYGQFIRSEAPVKLTAADIRLLREYGVKKSLDFRGDEDIKMFPSSLNTDGIEYIHLPMFGRADATGFDDPDPVGSFTGWGKSYIKWLECYKGWVRDVIHELAVTDGACHFNCNAGKDRTGIIAALVLSVAGVEISDIAFDYCISRAMLKPRFEQIAPQWSAYLKDRKGRLIEDHPFLFTPKEAMEQMFRFIYSKYVNTENYLRSCGVTDADILTLRWKMVN